MEKLEGYVFSAVCSAHFLVSCVLFSKITREQKDPYMDEVFHVPQAQKYCEGKFNQWDPMITTLPGLYLVSVGMIKPAGWVTGWTENILCSTGFLRFTNLLFSTGNLYLLYLLLCKIHQKDKAVSTFQRILSALALSSFPVLYFFTFLYYTDAGSTFFILFTYLMCLYGQHKTAALLGFCAFMFRQTNIIWVVFCAGSVVAQKLREVWKLDWAKKKEQKVTTETSVTEVKKVFQFLFEYMFCFNNLKTLVLLIWPYMLLVIGFFAFLIVNKGIVVGDRSSHEACLNFPQLFYFFSFAMIFSFSHLLSVQRMKKFFHTVRRHPALYVILTTFSVLLVWKFTYVHKYLLADNRHYTFYVWKKIFQRHELIKYLLVPGYIFAGWTFADMLKSKSVFWNLVFFVCLVAATVPQKLLEFRYFILPYLLYRLNIPVPSVPKLLLELTLYSVVNLLTVYLFLSKTFHWPQNEDIQRFMW
ncbi:dol-P-Glc:Glc(2)Man(9)GlcNAc(2)-PP-Dol alpha-1,2-glucosyltransferase [Latimeria chalumnae]|nr:PREDICTED: putative Dol-P-Glc:Glc(2)Man(9)GlcNAc(2)-PP-Dol alpha-1,2-glucosyltransferase [Latimeria chalumnae]|eukprot:XP_006002490.1 PREDICTED: putative Dol-P-Glc:Glc(2)Man(9)GlcNAc(2)-PP-Dol alpha-1,2-glucosyltransferase [Latimeria chalumnae]